MANRSKAFFKKSWNYRNILRDYGLSCGDSVELEQIKVVAERRSSVVVEFLALVTPNLQRTTRLRLSILQRAFEGKLLTEGLDS